jgi:predicted porin
MNKSLLALAAGSLLATSAFAQSSVTLYGIADVSIRYESNTNDSNDSRIHMTNGAITQSRWGLKGVEDLGGGLKGIFRLENGFSLDNGANNDSSSFFNRMAYVGLQGNFGAVTLGRQHSAVHDFLSDFDPLTVGNYAENSYFGAYYPVRVNNQVKYAGSFGGLNVIAGYGFGEQAGNNTAGRYLGTMVTYKAGPFGFGGAYQQSRGGGNAGSAVNLGGTDDDKLTNWAAGATFASGPFKAAAGYQDHRQKDASSTYKTNVWYAGLTYNVTPAFALTGAGYYSRPKEEVAGSPDVKGKRYTLVALAEYALSKRTQVYGTVDYTNVKDLALGDLNGPSKTNLDKNRTNVGIGVRHIF